MPTLVSEVTSGAAESESSDKASLTRAFRVVLSSPGENVDFQSACGVSIGSKLGNLVCLSYDAKYDGDSRMVALVTFQYEISDGPGGPGGGEEKDKPPDVRPANWSFSAGTIEQQVLSWTPRLDTFRWAGATETADNPVGDVYDGVIKLLPIINISVSQWETFNPSKNVGYVGSINSEEINFGFLKIEKHQLLFTSLNSTPVVETFDATTYRGWRVEYQFSYKKNPALIDLPEGGPGGGVLREQNVDIGWDIAVPQTGRNVKAFDPKIAIGADQDVFGQPLEHGNRGTEYYARVIPPPEGYMLSTGVVAGDRAPAMVKVFAYQGRGVSQAPSGQPISLNDDGTARKIDLAAVPPRRPIVYAYQVYSAVDLKGLLGLRLD